MSPALSEGACRLIEGGPADCLLYQREARTEEGTIERMLVAVNFSERPCAFTLPTGSSHGRVLLSTHHRAGEALWDPHHIELGPNEGRLVRLS